MERGWGMGWGVGSGSGCEEDEVVVLVRRVRVMFGTG